jgi:hypothetical protein
MGPSLRPFSYNRDPWWDPGGRVSRRRRRRRLFAWTGIVVLGISLGIAAGQARAAEPARAAPAPGHVAPEPAHAAAPDRAPLWPT